jgi:hypothetical protein
LLFYLVKSKQLFFGASHALFVWSDVSQLSLSVSDDLLVLLILIPFQNLLRLGGFFLGGAVLGVGARLDPPTISG